VDPTVVMQPLYCLPDWTVLCGTSRCCAISRLESCLKAPCLPRRANVGWLVTISGCLSSLIFLHVRDSGLSNPSRQRSRGLI